MIRSLPDHIDAWKIIDLPQKPAVQVPYQRVLGRVPPEYMRIGCRDTLFSEMIGRRVKQQ